MAGKTHRLSDYFYEKYLNEAEKIILEHHKQIEPFANREGVFCKPGCAGCCNAPFHVTQAEIDVITHWLINHPQILESFCAKLPKRLESIKNHEDIFILCDDKSEVGNKAALEFSRLNVSCSFLDQEKLLCTIYPVRPLICAAYVSIVPGRFCATEPKSTMSRGMREVFNKHTNALEGHLKKYKVDKKRKLDISFTVAERLQTLGIKCLEPNEGTDSQHES